MNILLPLSGALGHSERVLVARDMLRPPMGLLRAQVTSTSTALAADGLTWTSLAADAPRFAGIARHLLIEGQRTNGLRNPRAEGSTSGIIGSGGAWPANWSISSSAAPVAYEVVGTGTEDGIGYVDVAMSGTTASGSQITILTEASQQAAAAPGQTWTASAFLRLIAGSMPSTGRVRIFERSAAGGALVDNGSTASVTGAALSTQRLSYSGVLANPATAFVTMGVRIAPTIGVAFACTLRIGWPQLEQSGFASTPVLPAVGALAASTRGADLARATSASLGITGPCTILWSGTLPQAAPAGADQMLFQLDDGSANNRVRMRNLAGGAAILAGRVTGGTSADTASLGSMTPGIGFRAGLALDNAGRVAASLDGAAAQVVTGAPTSGLTMLRLGNDAAGISAMSGETRGFVVLPYALADAALAARVAALPL